MKTSLLEKPHKGVLVRVAEVGVEPTSGGYEPPEIPFLYSAIFSY